MKQNMQKRSNWVDSNKGGRKRSGLRKRLKVKEEVDKEGGEVRRAGIEEVRKGGEKRKAEIK